MTATRTRAQVIARDQGKDRFIKIEISTFGDGKNTQRQCATGELEFNLEKKRFVTVSKQDRKPFNPDVVATNDSVQIKDRL